MDRHRRATQSIVIGTVCMTKLLKLRLATSAVGRASACACATHAPPRFNVSDRNTMIHTRIINVAMAVDAGGVLGSSNDLTGRARRFYLWSCSRSALPCGRKFAKTGQATTDFAQ
jgi:hypothetical protein